MRRVIRIRRTRVCGPVRPGLGAIAAGIHQIRGGMGFKPHFSFSRLPHVRVQWLLPHPRPSQAPRSRARILKVWCVCVACSLSTGVGSPSSGGSMPRAPLLYLPVRTGWLRVWGRVSVFVRAVCVSTARRSGWGLQRTARSAEPTQPAPMGHPLRPCTATATPPPGPNTYCGPGEQRRGKPSPSTPRRAMSPP